MCSKSHFSRPKACVIRRFIRSRPPGPYKSACLVHKLSRCAPRKGTPKQARPQIPQASSSCLERPRSVLLDPLVLPIIPTIRDYWLKPGYNTVFGYLRNDARKPGRQLQRHWGDGSCLGYPWWKRTPELQWLPLDRWGFRDFLAWAMP